MLRLKFILFFSIIISFLSGCNEKEKIVTIGYNPISYNLPFFVAMEKRYFEEVGLKVEPIRFATSNLLAEALVANNVNVGTSISATVLFGIEQNVSSQFKIFMMHVSTSEKPADFILVKKGSLIKSIDDLRGKKIGTHQGSTMMIYAQLSLSKYFDPKKDVSIIQLAPEVQIQALETGSVDALFTYEPTATLCIKKGVGEILVSAPKNIIMDPFPSGAYAISSKFLRENPEEAKLVIQALNKAVDFIRQNETDAKKYITKYTSIPDSIANIINVIPYWKLDEIQMPLVQEFADILFKEGDLKKKMVVDSLFLSK